MSKRCVNITFSKPIKASEYQIVKKQEQRYNKNIMDMLMLDRGVITEFKLMIYRLKLQLGTPSDHDCLVNLSRYELHILFMP